MSRLSVFLFLAATTLMGPWLYASVDDQTQPKTIVKYRQGKDINFEELIIEGQLKRPELSVVTGDDEQGTNGLLRLRENFLDRMTVDASEEIP